MALWTKKEFAEKCNIGQNYLAVMEKRGKVVYSGDYVDDSLPVNKIFMAKMLTKLPRVKKSDVILEIEQDETEDMEILNEGENVGQVQKQVVTSKTPQKKFTKFNSAEMSPEMLEYLLAQREQQRLKNDKLIEEIKIAKKKNAKMEGEMIPKDMVQFAFTTHFKNYSFAFKNAFEKILNKYSKHFSNEEIAAIRKEFVTAINYAQHHAITESKKSIDEIIKESSFKKEVGEHD